MSSTKLQEDIEVLLDDDSMSSTKLQDGIEVLLDDNSMSSTKLQQDSSSSDSEEDCSTFSDIDEVNKQ